MILKKLIPVLYILACVAFVSCSSKDKPAKSRSAVKMAGSVKKTMWQGQLGANISLDTMADKEHLYGLGPIENLTGEIMINAGKAYKATVINDTAIIVEETFNIKAPFFAYTYVNNWKEQALPDSILTVQQLDDYLVTATKNAPQPFAFRLTATVDSATIYVIDVPQGMQIQSPGDADQMHRYFQLKNDSCEVIGFFATDGKVIFAPGETHLHMHILNAAKTKMGHLDAVAFKKGTVKLYLPAE